MSDLRARWKALTSQNAVVYGVNPGSRESHSAWSKKLSLPFPLLHDQGAKVARLYKAWFLFIVRRTVYAVDTEGRICFAQRGSPAPAQIAQTFRTVI